MGAEINVKMDDRLMPGNNNRPRDVNKQEFWIKQLHHFALQVAQCSSHIEFLSACLNMRVPPCGLTLKIPFSAMPPCMQESLVMFGHITSLQLTQLTHDLYVRLRDEQLREHLIPLMNITQSVAGLQVRAANIIQKATNALETKREHNNRKLSALFRDYNDQDIPLPVDILPCLSVLPPPPPSPDARSTPAPRLHSVSAICL